MSNITTFYPAIVVILLIAILLIAIRFKTGTNPKGIVLVSVAIIILGSVTVPLLFPSEKETGQDFENIKYDDYLNVEAETTASGALEIITIQGQTYLHAKDVGAGQYTRMGKTYTVEVSKANLDIYAILGQSNAAHELFNRTTSAQISPGCGYYFGDAYQVNQWRSGYNFTGLDMEDMRGTGYYQIAANIDAPFAAKYHELTGHKAYLINCGVGGTAISSWAPGASSWVYAQAVFDAAMKKIDLDKFEPQIKDYIWIQGEGDSGLAVNTYITRYLAIHDSLTNPEAADPFGYVFENAIISKVRATNGVNSSQAQLKLPAKSDNIHIATKLADTFTKTNGLMLGDNLHYSQQGDNIIGEAVAEYVANLHHLIQTV